MNEKHHDRPSATISVIKRISEWGGAASFIVILIVGLKFVLDTRSQLEAYIQAQNIREVNCDRERAGIQEDIKEIKITLEEFKRFYYQHNHGENP